MDSMIQESLLEWKQMYEQEDFEDAEDHLMAVMQHAIEMISQRNVPSLDSIRYKLELAVGSERPEHRKSYALGMAQGFVHLLNHVTFVFQQEMMTADLSPLEKRILRQIGVQPRITPTEIMEKVRIENKQQISNVLRKLRTKNLVNYWESGKNRFYDLTTIGHKILESLGSEEEMAIAVQESVPDRTIQAKFEDLVKDLIQSNVRSKVQYKGQNEVQAKIQAHPKIQAKVPFKKRGVQLDEKVNGWVENSNHIFYEIDLQNPMGNLFAESFYNLEAESRIGKQLMIEPFDEAVESEVLIA